MDLCEELLTSRKLFYSLQFCVHVCVQKSAAVLAESERDLTGGKGRLQTRHDLPARVALPAVGVHSVSVFADRARRLLRNRNYLMRFVSYATLCSDYK